MKLLDVFFLDLGASRLRGRTLATFTGGEREREIERASFNINVKFTQE